jgi:energy-coupling factor transporter transmembrane protein EcfT
MTPTVNRPGRLLLAGIAAVVAAAVSPAGLTGGAIPAWSWGAWAAVLAAALWLFERAGLPLSESLRRIGWLAPVVAMFALPAALLAPSGNRLAVGAALLARALAAAAMGAALAARLGPSGLVRAVRELGLPSRLADVVEAMLASLTIVLRQIRAMLRAREARRPGFGGLGAMAAEPVETVRGFGRLVASLLLRSLERAEAIETARRARGGGA